ncbi:MAG: ATP-dependent DNA helicase RecG [Patescibacteria group bacterium]|nr:ATP-dependent DNA helicase RecG [Patescibacteria group bacterium]
MNSVFLKTPLASVKGIGPKFIAKLEKIGITSVGDLLWHFPVRYDDWSHITDIKNLRPGEYAVIRAKVKKIGFRKSWIQKLAIVEASLEDESGSIRTIWFGQPFIKRVLGEGKQAFFSGKVLSGKRGIFLSNPAYEVVSDEANIKELFPQHELLAIYPETKGLTSKGIRFVIGKVLPRLINIPDFIPEEILKKNRFPEINQALKSVHCPKTSEEEIAAKRRFAFEELFLLQLGTLLEKKRLAKTKAPSIEFNLDFIKWAFGRLPYNLTFSQKRSLYEILKDLERHQPMNRLLQGDVGSGKTVIAAIAAMETTESGYQAVFMAPTEILANQHYRTFQKLFSDFGHPIGLLTAKSSLAFYGDGLESEMRKKDLLKEVENGKIKILIGTHALIAKSSGESKIKFNNLGLIVVDEQHRFGVRQRAELVQNQARKSSGLVPHFLSMSATPIPRTLAITIFGDLDLSTIDELPSGRKPIITKIVDPLNRDKAYAFIRGEIRKGRQAFVICPRIESQSESGDLVYEYENNEAGGLSAKKSGWSESKTVKEEFEKLSKKVFPDLRVAMLHGKMKAEEKQKTMSDFKEQKSDILVATSVVEVGVDVPNAVIMMIEGAERFGLAQLYQFRGRVGRGEHQSFCFLFTESSSETTGQRLKALLEAKNGFELAEKDLEIRGPGALLGAEQTGLPDTTMRALQNPAMIKLGRQSAEHILEKDASLRSYPALKERLEKFKADIHLE